MIRRGQIARGTCTGVPREANTGPCGGSFSFLSYWRVMIGSGAASGLL